MTSLFGEAFERQYLARLVEQLNEADKEFSKAHSNPNVTPREFVATHNKRETLYKLIALQCQHMHEEGLLGGDA